MKRYGDTKRGPYLLRYLVNDLGDLRIEARDGEVAVPAELRAAELEGDEGIARATEVIERVLRQIRDIMARR